MSVFFVYLIFKVIMLWSVFNSCFVNWLILIFLEIEFFRVCIVVVVFWVRIVFKSCFIWWLLIVLSNLCIVLIVIWFLVNVINCFNNDWLLCIDLVVWWVIRWIVELFVFIFFFVRMNFKCELILFIVMGVKLKCWYCERMVIGIFFGLVV